MLMKAAVLPFPEERLMIEQVELADPREGEILVRIVSCGICHTDEAQRHMIVSTSVIFSMVCV